jgi:hypothetical protein
MTVLESLEESLEILVVCLVLAGAIVFEITIESTIDDFGTVDRRFRYRACAQDVGEM